MTKVMSSMKATPKKGRKKTAVKVKYSAEEWKNIKRVQKKVTLDDPALVLHWHDGVLDDILLRLAGGQLIPPPVPAGQNIPAPVPPGFLDIADSA
jgi:hypothetical protein